jgi:tetratricopeptide (TPR) repeat protein
MSAVARRYYLRGRAALAKADLETALEAIKAAIDLVPTFSTARCAYCLALAKFGDCPRAAQTLRAGLARPATETAKAGMWATLGDVLLMGGDFLGAEDAFKQAGQQPAFEARAAAGLARAYGKLGRYPEAFEQLAQAATRHRDDELGSLS